MQAKIRVAVIPVAGEGTRMLPATKTIPKELLTVVDKPVIQYVVDEAVEAGIEHFVFVTGMGKSAIEDYFDRRRDLEQSLTVKGKARELALLSATSLPPGVASFTRQQDPLGLGHAIWCARAVVGNEPFAVLLPDVISADRPCAAMRQLVDAYTEIGGNCIATERVPETETHKYGIVDIGQSEGRLCRVKRMVEKPSTDTAPSNLMIMGRYILQPEIFDILACGVQGAGGEVQLTDAMRSLLDVQSFYSLELSARSYDCGSPVGLFEANVALALGHPELSARARATIFATLAAHDARQTYQIIGAANDLARGLPVAKKIA